MNALNLCCIINPHLQCDSCGQKVCERCKGWMMHPMTDWERPGGGHYWECPITHEIVVPSAETPNVHFILTKRQIVV